MSNLSQSVKGKIIFCRLDPLWSPGCPNPRVESNDVKLIFIFVLFNKYYCVLSKNLVTYSTATQIYTSLLHVKQLWQLQAKYPKTSNFKIHMLVLLSSLCIPKHLKSCSSAFRPALSNLWLLLVIIIIIIRAVHIREVAPQKVQRALDLAAEKGSSVWLTVLPLREMGFNLNKREFRDAIKLRYDWPVDAFPSTCICGDIFTVDHAMICKRGGFITQRHNELRDLEADLLSMVCSDVEIEPVLQDISGEQLGRGSNRAPDARLDIHARGFWEN